jgi:hypothetical protein
LLPNADIITPHGKKGYLQKGVRYPKGKLERAGSSQRATNKEQWFVAFKGCCRLCFQF